MANNFNTLVFLRGFNNYFNRVIKRYETLSEYLDNSSEHYTRTNRNFNPNDGITTEHIENGQEVTISHSDYLLVLNEYDEIISRWFITECVRTRNQQYSFSLKRDVVAEHYNEIINSPCYVEKGTLNEDDPLIFNGEGMSFNQIKKDEILLQDKSGVPWIVGYISRDYLSATGDEAKKISGRYNVIQAAAIDSSELPWDFTPTAQIVGQTTGYRMRLDSGSYRVIVSTVWSGVEYSNEYPYTEQTTLKFNSIGQYTGADNVNNHPNAGGSGSIVRYTTSYNFDFIARNGIITSKNISTFIEGRTLGIGSVPQSIIDEQRDPRATSAELLTYNNKIVKDGQRYYRLKVEQVEEPTYDYLSTDYPILKTNLDEFITEWNAKNSGTQLQAAAKPVTLSAVFDGVRITPEVITQEELEVYIPKQADRIHLNDAPYDMFCIPYGDIHLKKANIDCNKDGSLAIAFYAAAELGASVVYDLQLLPYCPVPDYIIGGKLLDESFGQEGYEYNYIKDTQGNKKSIMLWCTNSSGTFNIDKKIEIDRPNREVITPGSERLGNTDIKTHNFTYNRSKRGGDVATLTLQDPMFKVKKVLTVEDLMVQGTSPVRPWEVAWTDTPTLADELSFSQNMELGILNITYRNSNAPLRTNTKLVLYTLFIQWETSEIIYDNTKAVDIKVSDACDMYRLVSPNYNGQFEFSLAKNGAINYFNVDYNYKPHTPYIHINPDFAGLYGWDWNDARGLICGGDFSLPVITSAWTDYQINNKNYQNIFDRQIQNMEVTHDIQKQQAIASAIGGTITGGASGATSGAMIGAKAGPYGAAAGAIVGGVMGTAGSLTGGLMDIQNVDKAYKESRSYAKDMYDYNLQNIQAIPYSLAKTSAFTYNNKIWPMVERYSCTNQEKAAFRDKLRYDGMTVMKIDKLASYISPIEQRYVKGQLIRLPILEEDSHMANIIYDEISKGVYL